MKSPLRHRALFALLLGTVFLQGLFELRETDLWVHLNLGRLVFDFERGAAAGPMVYAGPPDSRFGAPSWLFGSAAYLLWSVAGGAAAVILAKCALVTLAFFVLLRDALRPYGDRLAATGALLVVLAASRFRFVERPDIVVMLLLAFQVFALNAWFRDGRRLLWLLPVSSLVWANSHASAVLVPVVFAIFLGGGLLQLGAARLGWRLEGTPTPRRLGEAALVALTASAATLLNPARSGILSAGGDVLAMDWARQNILELQRPIWTFNPWPFVLTVLLLVTFALNFRRLCLVDVLLAVPFAWLAFSVKRFVVLLAVVSGPILARNLAGIRRSWRERRKPREGLELALAAAAVIALGAYFLLERPRFDAEARRFGLGIDERTVPEQALQFLDREAIEGRIFNTLAFGGYVAWRDYPRRTVFIDPRFNLPGDLLTGVLEAHRRPEVLDRLHERFGFEALVLAYPSPFENRPVERVFVDDDLYLRHPGWVLVHWDDVALVYLRRDGPHAEVVARRAVRRLRPANLAPFDRFRVWDPEFARAAEAELARTIAESGALRAYLVRGLLRTEIGRYEAALPDFDAALPGLISLRPVALEGKARALAGVGRWPEAVAVLRELVRVRPNGSAYLRLALAEERVRETGRALRHFARAVALNPNLLSAYREGARLSRKVGDSAEANRLERRLEAARRVDRTGGAIRRVAEARARGQGLRVIEELEKALAANPADPALLSELGFALYDRDRPGAALEYQSAALDVDPAFANAWYGLALVHRDAGRPGPAAACFRRFLELDPDSAFAGRARRELAALGVKGS